MKLFLSTIIAGCVFTRFARSRPSQSLATPGTLDPNLEVADCDSKPDWTARNFLKEDCYVSVLDMFLQDYRPHPQAKFDFYSSFYPAPPGSNRLQTPKRYTTKSCTLALVMLYNFKSAELPGTFRTGHLHSELATFGEIYTTAQRLQRNCIVGQGQGGRLAWEPVGQTKSLGVFFWATDSEINHDPRFPNRFTAENHINASAVDGFVHSFDR
ncbi:MAG: hypothetical protein L6R38_007052 [Xanthoria sp. 2 TBL-2021]|nr:MAG: hypothetical protein L6R38_007052 [Xanthoria sp. 2 TBL-2021]